MSDISSDISDIKIPKIIHQIWTQGCDKVPDKYKPYIEKWKSFKKYGYEYKCWDDESIIKDMKKNEPDLIHVYKYFDLPQQRSDVGRYYVIYRYGGIYSDIDIEPHNILVIEDIIRKNELMTAQDRFKDVLSQQFLGAKPFHPFLRDCLDFIKKNYKKEWYDILQVLYVERTTGGHMYKTKIKPYIDNVHVISPELFVHCDINNCADGDYSDKLAVVHFQRSWNPLVYIQAFIIFYRYVIMLTSIFLLLTILSSCRNKFINYLCLTKNIILAMTITTLFYIMLNLIVNGFVSRDGLFYLILLFLSYYCLSKKCTKCSL